MTDLPQILTLRLPGGVPLELRRIPAGSFRMGSRGETNEEEPAHWVKIPEPFYLGTFPVIQAQYRAMATACLEKLQAIAGNEGVDPSHFKGDLHPVEKVSWDEANVIGHWLSHSGLLPAGWQAGLPSEAMWEYACRGGTATDYWSGDGEAALAEVGWFEGNSDNATRPVGELPANGWGLHDLHGNVWEWCADVWDAKAYRKRIDCWQAAAWSDADAGDDAKGEADAHNRVRRGGSWNDTDWYCRAALRGRVSPNWRLGYSGFRLCVFPGPEKCKQEPAAATGAEQGAAAAKPRDEAEQAQAASGAHSPHDADLGAATFPPRSGGDDFSTPP